MHLARDLQLHKAKEKDQGNVFSLIVREKKLLTEGCEKADAFHVSFPSFSFPKTAAVVS